MDLTTGSFARRNLKNTRGVGSQALLSILSCFEKHKPKNSPGHHCYRRKQLFLCILDCMVLQPSWVKNKQTNSIQTKMLRQIKILVVIQLQHPHWPMALKICEIGSVWNWGISPDGHCIGKRWLQWPSNIGAAYFQTNRLVQFLPQQPPKAFRPPISGDGPSFCKASRACYGKQHGFGFRWTIGFEDILRYLKIL